METDPKTTRAWEIVEPIALEAGLELVDVEHRREGRGTVLRLLIDKPGGISVEELARVSREVSDVLDAQPEAVPGSYTLEVSSAGLDRKLYSLDDARRFVGRRVRVKTEEPVPMASDVVLMVSPPGAEVAMPLSARICWKGHPGGLPGFGVEWKARDAGGTRRIKELVRRIEAQGVPLGRIA